MKMANLLFQERSSDYRSGVGEGTCIVLVGEFLFVRA